MSDGRRRGSPCAARAGLHPARPLVLRSRHPRARARADLLPLLAVRRAGRVARPGRCVLRRAGRPHAGRGGARRRRDPRVRERLPPPRRTSSPRTAAARRRCSARTTRGRTASTARCATRPARNWRRLRPGRARAAAGRRRHVGAAGVREPRRGRGAAAESLGPLPGHVAASGVDLAALRLRRVEPLDHRRELEDGPREHARVLPLPGRPPRASRGSSTWPRAPTN